MVKIFLSSLLTVEYSVVFEKYGILNIRFPVIFLIFLSSEIYSIFSLKS